MKNNIRRMLIKSVALLTGGVIVGFAFLVNIDTHSWFTNEAMQEIKVTAATTEDIIKNIDIEKDNNGNAIAIKLIKAEGLNYDPIIYFSVEGEAANYILHINPVKLTDSEEYIIPIEPNINTIQYTKLLLPWHKNIEGTIKIKYLNEFIDEGKEISFTPKYLREKFWEIIDREKVKSEKISDPEALNEATELITLVTDSFEWEEDNKTRSMFSIDSDSIYESNLVTPNAEEDSENVNIERFSVLPNMVISLTPQQTQIISAISFNLLPHIEKLYDAINNLVALLNEKLVEIARLNTKVEGLEGKNEEQKNKIEEQIIKIEELELKNQELISKNEELENKNLSLNEEVAALSKDKDALLEEIEALDSRNSSLSSDNRDLSRENSILASEIESLRRQIDELMTRGGGGGAGPVEEPEQPEEPEVPADSENSEEPSESEIPEKPDETTLPEESAPEPIPESDKELGIEPDQESIDREIGNLPN